MGINEIFPVKIIGTESQTHTHTHTQTHTHTHTHGHFGYLIYINNRGQLFVKKFYSVIYFSHRVSA